MLSSALLARVSRAGLRPLGWRSYYKPGQMKKLYDEVQKDVVLFRYEAVAKVVNRWRVALLCTPLGLYMGGMALDLRGLMEGWEARVEDARTKYLMNNVKWTSRGLGVFWLMFLPGLSIYYTQRTLYTVRKLVLRKGGKVLSIQTYGVTKGGGRWVHAPVSDCEARRVKYYTGYRDYLNVKDHKFRFIFNMEEGVVSSRALFDRAIGLGRPLTVSHQPRKA